MKKNISLGLLSVVLLALTSCALDPNVAGEAVLQGERDRVQLLQQEMSDLDSLTIDSLLLTCYDEPMSGYLYTTWYWTRKTQTRQMVGWGFETVNTETPMQAVKIISVTDIHKSKEHKDYIEWISDWGHVYFRFQSDELAAEYDAL